MTTAVVVGRLTTPPTAAPIADRSSAPMRTPATSPDAVTTGMLSAMTGSCASRGSTTTPGALQRAAGHGRGDEARGDERRAAARAAAGHVAGAGQHVARRVGQQQAGEPRPQPLLLRQRQRAADGERLIPSVVAQAPGDGAQRRLVLGHDVADPVADQPDAVGELGAGAALGGAREQAAQAEAEQGQRDRRQRDELMEQLRAQPLRLGRAGPRAQPLNRARQAGGELRQDHVEQPGQRLPGRRQRDVGRIVPEQPADADDQHRDAEEDPVGRGRPGPAPSRAGPGASPSALPRRRAGVTSGDCVSHAVRVVATSPVSAPHQGPATRPTNIESIPSRRSGLPSDSSMPAASRRSPTRPATRLRARKRRNVRRSDASAAGGSDGDVMREPRIPELPHGSIGQPCTRLQSARLV